MTLGRKYTEDTDQQIHIMPLQMNQRCRCTQQTDTMLLMDPTNVEQICNSRVADITRYVCQEAGESYCRLVLASGWVANGPEANSMFPCVARNVTKAVYEVDVGDVNADAAAASTEWSQWPSFTPAPFPYPN